MKTLIAALQKLVETLEHLQVSMPPNTSRITEWALAVQTAEGWTPHSVSYACNNPGNLKYSTLTASWGATKAQAALDGGNFCQFKTYEEGFQALVNFLTLGAENELIAFHQARTLETFTNVYAGNPPQGYINTICNCLKVEPSIDVSVLLA